MINDFARRSSLTLILSLSLSTFIVGTAYADETANPAPEDIGKEIRFPVEKYKLANGLTVVLQENHSAPIVTYQTWFKVGSKYEEPSYTGIAHLFEHMMFKGAKRYSGEQFDTILQANGATNNAFTTQDYTGYYENLPSSKIELVMDIESDRMVNLAITPENLQSEKQVVKEERRFRVDNSQLEFYAKPFTQPRLRFIRTAGPSLDIWKISITSASKRRTSFITPTTHLIMQPS